MRKVVILGATSTIAQELARLLAEDGSQLLLIARSGERLSALRSDLMIRGAAEVQTLAADFRDCSRHQELLQWATANCRDFDTLILAYGSMREQDECEHSAQALIDQLQTDFVSAAAVLNTFAEYFEQRRGGTIAAITSVAGDRGRRSNYAYGAAKGGLSLFLQGLRARLHNAGVRVITIKPGPVRTAMTDHMPQGAMFAEVSVVARDIYHALSGVAPEVLYTPRRWRFIMLGVRAVPERIFKRLAI